MAAPLYISWSGDASALTAQLAGVSLTSATLKTVQQVAPTKKIRVVEWGFQFLAVPSSPVQVELIQTDVAATVTAGQISRYNDTTGDTSDATVSTSGTGYNATAEGTITATRLLSQKIYQADFAQQFPLGREAEVEAGKFLRVRARQATGSSLTIVSYVIWER